VRRQYSLAVGFSLWCIFCVALDRTELANDVGRAVVAGIVASEWV